MKLNFISNDIYKLNKFNVVTYQALHYALNKKKIKDEDELEEEETTTRVKTESIEYDLIQALKDNNIKTIVLDEAHHLRAEWWKSLCKVLNSLEDIKVISLTATPPYDVEESEWRKYEEVCGRIDAEISVPELVATGDLCPHQDYVIFNMVTKNELSEIKKIRNGIDDFLESLKQNNEFIEMIKSNKIINSWKEYEETILTDTMYYGSMIIFLNSIGLTIDKNLVKLISDGYLIPSFNKKWAEILLENVIYEHKEDYLEHEELIKKIKKELEILGCVEKRKIYLENVNNIKKIMASSIAKIDSIEEIAKKEYESLGNDLSMVVLADYVRSDFIDCDIEKINKLGVVPIFRRLQEKHICDNLAILTGKLKIVPKNVVPYIKEQLQLLELDNKAIFKDLKIDNNYVVITGGKKVNSAIVKIVTDCINLKKINIVIGTVALLGEGWDAPAINSLILASYVGSFMLSNQMRGRAIRKSKNINKTANIWHLASLAELGYNNFDFSDLELLQRRFKCFVGIAYYEDLIQDGIERLNIIDIGSFETLASEDISYSFGQISGVYGSNIDLYAMIREQEEISVGGGYKMNLIQVTDILVEQYPKVDLTAQLLEVEALRAEAATAGEDTSEYDSEISRLKGLISALEGPETASIKLAVNGVTIFVAPGRKYHLNENINSLTLVESSMPIVINYVCQLNQVEDLSAGVVSAIDASRIWGQISGIFTGTDKVLRYYNYDYLNSETFRIFSNNGPEELLVRDSQGDIIIDNTTFNLYKTINIYDIIKEETQKQVELIYGTKFELNSEGQLTDGEIYYSFSDIILFDIEADEGTTLYISSSADGSNPVTVKIGPTCRYTLNPMDNMIKYIALAEPQFCVINYKCLTNQMQMKVGQTYVRVSK